MSKNDWVRPASVSFPTTYRRFKGRKPMPDGRTPKFWIEDGTEDMTDEIVEDFVEYFLKDEVMSKSLDIYNKQKEGARKMFQTVVPALIRKRLTVIAMTDWPNGKPQMVGFNVLFVLRRGEEIPIPEEHSKIFGAMREIVLDISKEIDVCTKYGVEEYTLAIGLSVKPEFRGQNVGVELLKARNQMTRAVGIKLSVNTFTGPASQKQAERAGYELLLDRPYSEMKDDQGKELFPGIESKSIQLRAKYLGGDESD